MNIVYIMLNYLVDFAFWALISFILWMPVKWVFNLIISSEIKNGNTRLKKIETNYNYLGFWCVLTLEYAKALLQNIASL